MVTIWTREALAHFVVCTGQRENFRHQRPYTQMSRPPAESHGPRYSPAKRVPVWSPLTVANLHFN